MFDPTTQQLAQDVVNKLSQVCGNAWNVYLNQARMLATVFKVSAGLFGGLSAVLMILGFSWGYRKSDNYFFLVVIGFATLIITAFQVYYAVLCTYNPAYYAIQDILGR